VKGPTIAPCSAISSAYGADDLWMLQAGIASGEAAMRAETTATSYAYAAHLLKTGHRMPLCVWHAGKRYQRETNDGAPPAKMRFLEFWRTTKDRSVEVASVSIRMDFADDVRVLEVAFGLNILVELRRWEDKRRRATA
jgi:hypothetical protein